MRPDGNTARAAAVLAVVVLVVAVVIGMVVARPVAAQEGGGTDPTTAPTADATTPASTPETSDPGETSTTLADLDTPEGPVREAPLTESEKASRTIDWVVGGLLLLALVVAVATVVFWRRTRPARLVAEEMAETAHRGLGPSPAAVTESSWSRRPQPEAPRLGASQPAATTQPGASQPAATTQPGASQPAAGEPRTGAPVAAPAVATPPRPLPTAPGSWGAFAAAVGLEESTGTEMSPSSQQPPEGRQIPAATEVAGAEQATGAHPVVQPPEAPRPAFENASTGSWASQGWGEQGGGTPPVLPQGFAGSDTQQGSWRWNERPGHGRDAAAPAAPQVDRGEDDDAADRGARDEGDPDGEVSGPL